MDSLKSALFLICCEIPKEEPIKKQALLLPDNLIFRSFSESSSELNSFPSGVSTQNQAFLGMLLEIREASLSRRQ